MSSKVNITHLQQAKDSARIYKWDVQIQFGQLQSDFINVRCTSIDVPNPTHNVIDVAIRGFTKKEAGAVDWNDITLTAIEVEDYTLLFQLYELGRSHFDYETGVQAKKSTYSGGGTGGSSSNSGIKIMLEALDDSISGIWNLYGCVLQTYTPPQMSNDKGTAVELPFTVSYDYAKLLKS